MLRCGQSEHEAEKARVVRGRELGGRSFAEPSDIAKSSFARASRKTEQCPQDSLAQTVARTANDIEGGYSTCVLWPAVSNQHI